MDKDEIAYAIRRVINGELDDAERAIKKNDSRRALNEIDDAITKLKRLINSL